MKRAAERFWEYVQVGTASDPYARGDSPSTRGQLVLARLLANEMQRIGLTDVHMENSGYVYATLPATPGYEAAPALGLIAHLDTSPDAPGENVRPLLHKNYNGEDVVLPGGHTIRTEVFPLLKECKGQTLITASGGTLLGADDKAGIAEILSACEQVWAEGIPHGKLCVAFTPDEEIGRGADGFDVKGFGANFAYTVDGSAVNEVEYETFNAATAHVSFSGVAVHPGEAKDIMVNALRLAAEFDRLLPAQERPETTEGYEGFYHLTRLEGGVAGASSEYLIRDHDKQRFEQRKQTMREMAEKLCQTHQQDCVTLSITDSYYNMSEVIEQHFHLVENAKRAIRAVGLEPKTPPVRGGTDGSRLSFMGLPCPNLGTGGMYFHGPSECITAEAMDKAVAVIVELIKLYAGEAVE